MHNEKEQKSPNYDVYFAPDIKTPKLLHLFFVCFVNVVTLRSIVIIYDFWSIYFKIRLSYHCSVMNLSIRTRTIVIYYDFYLK